MKHLQNLRVGILTVFSLENLSDFPRSFCQVIFHHIIDIWSIACYETLGPCSNSMKNIMFGFLSICLFYRQFTRLQSSCQSQPAFCGLRFQCQFSFQGFWICPTCASARGQSDIGRLSTPVKSLVKNLVKFSSLCGGCYDSGVNPTVHVTWWETCLELCESSQTCQYPQFQSSHSDPLATTSCNSCT